jgi:nuclear receptor subfamily 2 group B protein 4
LAIGLAAESEASCTGTGSQCWILCCVVEVRGLKSGQEVELLREKVYAALEEYTRATHPDEPGRFAKLLLRLPALRSIGLKCLEHLFFFRLIGDVPIDEFLTEMLESRSDP